jgi:biotin carboxyl carrier protein
MDLRKLKTLIDLVAESDISELEVTEGEGKVRIVKSQPQYNHGHATANDAASASHGGASRGCGPCCCC